MAITILRQELPREALELDELSILPDSGEVVAHGSDRHRDEKHTDEHHDADEETAHR